MFKYRAGTIGLLAVACLASFTADGWGQSQAESVDGVGGWPIRFSYFPALKKLPGSGDVDVKKAPVVILMHGQDGDRSFWDKRSAPPGGNGKAFAEVLQSQGFAVVSLDLRKHGESKREGESRIVATDYELMVGDLAAVKDFIMKEHQQERLNMAKLGIVALDDSVPVATTFAEMDWKLLPYDDHAIPSERTPRGQDVKCLVLISPSTNAGKTQAANSLRYLANPNFNIAFMFAAGSKDSTGMKSARTLYKMVSNRVDAEHGKLEQFDTNERSQHLFGNPRVRAEIPILQFLITHLRERDIPWQDRRSRTDRS